MNFPGLDGLEAAMRAGRFGIEVCDQLEFAISLKSFLHSETEESGRAQFRRRDRDFAEGPIPTQDWLVFLTRLTNCPSRRLLGTVLRTGL